MKTLADFYNSPTSTYKLSSITVDLTSCLLASKPSKLTKQLICNRKSIKTAKPAKREKVLTAGILDKAPAEGKVNTFIVL